jgi:hypothetical protein
VRVQAGYESSIVIIPSKFTFIFASELLSPTNIVEQSIKWWCRAGRNSTQALDWLRQNIDEQIGHYDNIALYIWIGTRDLTTKNKQYISLTSC